ncbi:HK97 family phage prohead protease [Bradyrhizobium japonicum]|uniref:Prohead serine protease domain-containing protein n=1 Tax=Bradyrhizobium japonicum TaxID=375 RepID=A0A1Y2JAQ9_BRAJP|nr:HK97 family phage prohead protease [Bradyrhizobium japonicum]OSJ22064.1 hypothetical protein BSZ19_46535 [Bradyrhizobium japonicum]
MTIVIDPADLRSLERSEARAFRVERGGAMNVIFDVVEDQALDGQILKFNEVFTHKGERVALGSGCFGDISNRRVGFWIDHQASFEVASTDDALSVMIDDEGVQFRLDLDQCKDGPMVARMCNSGNRASMSVGCDILAERKEEIDGETVRVITRARLTELTICAEGAAGDNAFAFVVDKTATPRPVAGHRSATFRAAQMLHKLSRKVRSLKAQAISTSGTLPRPRRSMTLDQLNSFQTAEIERLQAVARGRHGLFL